MLKRQSMDNLVRWVILISTVCFGVYFLFFAKAATSTVGIESENGATPCNELKTVMSGTSNNSAVKFKSGLCSATSVNINDWVVPDDTPPQYSTILVRGEREGNFRVVCWASHLNYDDPIVNDPSLASSQGKAHLHMFFGNTGANYRSTATSLKNSGDGTCSGGPLNRSAYWIPTLFDASGKARIPSVINVYYKTQNVSRLQMNYLPAGLRMIAGDSKAMSPQNDWGAARITWTCVGTSINQKTIPACDPGMVEQNKGVQMVLNFPQCWDGINLDSSDHKSHMAYEEQGSCPASHPKALPEVTYNILWSNPEGPSTGWYFSSDKMKMPDGTTMNMPGGTTTHGDWFGGWEDSIMRTFVDSCLKDGKSADWGRLCDGRRLKAVPNYNTTITSNPPTSVTSQVNLPRPF